MMQEHDFNAKNVYRVNQENGAAADGDSWHEAEGEAPVRFKPPP